MSGDQLPWSAALARELGAPRSVRAIGSSPRSRVWRVRLAAGRAVVKQLVGDGFDREVTGLRLAGAARPAVVPELLAVDAEQRVLVLRAVEHGRPGRDWVLDWASGLAGVHASLRPGSGLPDWTGPGVADVTAFLGLAARLDVDGEPARAELVATVERLGVVERPALLHGDPCPGNDLYARDGVRFVDFEQAAIGNGLVELAYLRIGFPSCWCVTDPAPDLVAEAQRRYHAIAGTDPDADLTDACVGWLVSGDALVPKAQRGTVDQLARLVEQDWSWGTVSARERLAYRLRVVADMTKNTSIGRLCAELGQAVGSRWPGLGAPPARRPRRS